ncbi:MAG TPA: hypothetical protein VFS37_01245 [Conexibacter sp.]|nr:hypothetical protein [Conexibacter sp.]
MLAALAGGFGCGSSEEVRTPTPAAVAPDVAARPPRGMRAYAVVRRVEATQRAAFALLRTPPEPLPADTRRLLGPPLFGMSWRLAQRIPVALAGRYWLVPGNRHLCVVEQGSMGSPGAGSTCARAADAIAHGLADIVVKRAGPVGAAAPSGPARLIVGVAPDGARAVRVDTRGRTARVPVADGVFVLRDRLVLPPDRFVAVR